jgi:four helix bundle protein
MVYRITERFPTKEQYGLTSQIRRGSSSILANIAEGCGRGTKPDFARFLQIAMGSASELEYHLLLAYDLGLLSEGKYLCLNDEITQIKRMLSSLIQRLTTEN